MKRRHFKRRKDTERLARPDEVEGVADDDTTAVEESLEDRVEDEWGSDATRSGGEKTPFGLEAADTEEPSGLDGSNRSKPRARALLACGLMLAVMIAGGAMALGAVRGEESTDVPAVSDAPEIPAFVGLQHELPSGKDLVSDPDLYKWVAQTGCVSVPGGWKAIGTARNLTDERTGFSIVVFFTDAQARIVDSATTTVHVAAGEEATWAAQREFEAPKGTRCVVRAVSAS